MEPSELKNIKLHTAGATVEHKSPFADLEVFRNEFELSSEFISKWVIPFYMSRFERLSAKQERAFIEVFNEIDHQVTGQLLGDFNWRTRIVGAYFSALRDLKEFEDIIGTHLLKSDVCLAGRGYCLALASFGTPNSKEFLCEYLRYYLTKTDLWFDQGDALAALYYLDENEGEKFMPQWNAFIHTKPNWVLKNFKDNFSASMEAIKRIKLQVINSHVKS